MRRQGIKFTMYVLQCVFLCVYMMVVTNVLVLPKKILLPLLLLLIFTCCLFLSFTWGCEGVLYLCAGEAHRGLQCKVRELLMKENDHGK